jgi:hypothetical protein
VVRERSAKPLCVGSIPTRASNLFDHLTSDAEKNWLPFSCQMTAKWLFSSIFPAQQNEPKLRIDNFCSSNCRFVHHFRVVNQNDKDVVLLGASLWTAADAYSAITG